MTVCAPAIDSSPAEDPLPRIFAGRYRLVVALAGGGMATAYRGWDDDHGRLVVVKIPRAAAAGDDDWLVRFDREVRTAAALEHRHIVPVLDFGVTEGRPFMVMPFLAGGSLAARLPRDQQGNRQPLSAATLHAWLPAIAEALDHAHEQGVLHRDVKPANIFFDAFGAARLGDFGIAKFVEERGRAAADADLTRTNLALGTDYYMAPERFSPRPSLDGRSDQYSLAVCVYEILAGKRPFQGTTDHIVVEHCTAAVPALPNGAGGPLPESLRAAVAKGLAKKPTDRFASCTAFAEAVLADVPAPAVEPSTVTVACPRCSRLLRMPLTAAGGRGACRSCRSTLAIAADGSAVWPVGENMRGVEPAAAAASPPAGGGRRKRWHAPVALAAALAATGIAIAIAWAAWRKTPEVPLDPEPRETLAAEVPAADPSQPDSAMEVAARPAPAPDPSPRPIDDESEEVAGGQHDPNDPAALAADSADIAANVPGNASEPAGEMTVAIPAGHEAAVPEPLVPAAPATLADTAPADPTPANPPPPDRAPLLGEMHWVRVGDPGNEADSNGLGCVAKTFLIGRYELTNDEYCRFLNGSSAGRENRHGISDGPTQRPEAAIRRIGEAGQFRYEVVAGKGLLPAVGLRWCDAARLANWLHNGGGPEADTETGAYAFTDRQLDDATAFPHDPEARVWIPSLDEWYKAAYFKCGGPDAGYWKFPTGANSPPKACAADADGFGIPDGRSANFTRRSRWSGEQPLADGGCLTIVGSNGPPGPSGAFDMGGNAAELVTVLGENAAAGNGLCGGDAGANSSAALDSEAQIDAPSGATGGVRLAMADHPGGFAPRPPLVHERRVEVPKPIRTALESLQGILARVAEAPQNQSTPKFFEDALARANEIRDLGLTAAVRRLRDDVKSLLVDFKTEAETHGRAVVQLQGAAGTLQQLGMGQGVNALFAADMRTLESAYETARKPLLARAAEMARAAEALLAGDAKKLQARTAGK